jgi:glutathione S-transferase
MSTSPSSNYTLYFTPGACSMAVHVALLECGQNPKLEKVDMMAGQNRSPEYLKINPRGQVPVLKDGDQVIYEGAAQMIHILEKHHNPLLPTSGKERTDALQWLMYCNASLHPAYARVFFLMKNGADDATKAALMDTAVAMINKQWQIIEDRLTHSPYLAGDKVTIADILLTVIANWSPRMPKPVTLGPKTKSLLQKIISRPAFQEAMKIEDVEYKAAA